MPFLGKTPAQGFVNSVTKDDFTPNGSTTAFVMSKAPATVNEIEVYVGNVRQEPTSAYSVSGTTLTMTEAPATNTNFYVMHIGGTTQSSTTLPGGSTVPGDFDVSGKLGIGTSTHHDSSTKLTAAGRINTSNGTATGSINYGGGSVVNMGSLTNHPVQLMVNNSTKWKIDTNGNLISAGGGGIVLGNTSYAASNELDDYEEGVFSSTPAFAGGSNTTNNSTGTYIKVGKMVFININLNIVGATASGSGDYYITGLPFLPAAYTTVATFPITGFSQMGDGGICAQIATTNRVQLYYVVNDTGDTYRGISSSHVNNAATINIRIAGCYETDA